MKHRTGRLQRSAGLGSAIAMAALLVAAAPALGQATTTTTTTTTAVAAPAAGATVPAVTIVAAQKTQKIGIYATAGGARPTVLLDRSSNFSGRHVFVVLAQEGEWLKVLVPLRPNGHSGYIRLADVALYQHDYYITISLTERRLALYKSGKLQLSETVAIGQNRYPTPTGLFFARELARPSNPRGAYGPWAFGLSAYSNVLQKFGRGDGQIGIHGTNQPGLLGQPVSHGCIRMSNAAITKLAQVLPQGVPVDIRA